MKAKIIELVNAIDISSENEIKFNNEFISFFNYLNLNEDNVINCINEIKQKLYETYSNQKELKGINIGIEQIKKQLEIYRQLQNNWLIEHENINGSIIATDGSNRRFLNRGEYLIVGKTQHTNYNKHILFYKNHFFEDDNFIYFFGNYFNEVFPFSIIRIYFNIIPNGLKKWIKIIQNEFEKRQIYFGGKILKTNFDFQRADSAVLYLDKRCFFDSKPLLNEILEKISPFLKPETPLFTLKLQDGIGFAENPSNPNESFGMSRCRLIAEGIWQAHENKLPKADWPTHVINYIESQGYNLDKFYLNPNSRFPYNFD